MSKGFKHCLFVLSMLLCLLVCRSTGAQGNNDIQELTIGDSIPSIKLQNILNVPNSSLNLNEFKGKLVILDFWAIWCGPCIAALPGLESLQKRFGDKIKIITVTNEKKEAVQKFLLTNKIGKQIISLPIVYEDTLLSKYFNYVSVPHEVWINPNRVVEAITTEQYVKEENIQAVLDGKKTNWPVKREVEGFDLKTSLFLTTQENSNTSIAKPLYYSGFTSYTHRTSHGLYIQPDTTSKSVRYNQYNCPLLYLYSIAFTKTPVFINNPKLCSLNVANLSSLVYNENQGYWDTWVTHNYYSYEAVLPIATPDSLIRRKLKNDLDVFFGFESRVEKRNLSCLILKRIHNSALPLKSSDELPRQEMEKSKKGLYHYMQRHNSIKSLEYELNTNSMLRQLSFVIDETEINYSIDLELNLGTSVLNIDLWRKELNKYGIDLVSEMRQVDILIINDNKVK